jgi:hypothetical protein
VSGESADRADDSTSAAEVDDLQGRAVLPLREVVGDEQEPPAAGEAAEGNLVAAGEFVNGAE